MDLEALFQQFLEAQSLLLIGVAFVGGVVSTFLPCSVAMLPIVIGYVGGYAEANTKWDVFLQVLLFNTGLALVLTGLGIAVGLLGLTFGAWAGGAWFFVPGTVAILMGLQLLGMIQLRFPHLIRQLPQSGVNQTGAARYLAPVLLGMTFGAATSPCGTPFLAGILALLSNAQNIVLGGAGLFAYAIGQGTLLMIVGLFTGLLKHQAKLYRAGPLITRLSAGVFILAGIALYLEASGLLPALLGRLGF